MRGWGKRRVWEGVGEGRGAGEVTSGLGDDRICGGALERVDEE